MRDARTVFSRKLVPVLAALALAAAPAAVLAGCSKPAPVVSERGPLVIAHRGASGYLPEHTLAAYTLAIAQGADYIEPDLVLSRDGELVCAHDLTMNETTDVARKFPGRSRDDGRFYWIDFDLYELRQLARTGPTPRTAEDGAPPLTGHTVCTLDDVAALVKHLSGVEGRTIGLIPEPKNPAFHAENSRPIGPSLTGALAALGYRTPVDPAIIQCFDLAELERMAGAADGPQNLPRLVWLVSETPTADELERAQRVCHGIGPNKSLLEGRNGLPRRLLIDLRERGLAAYPWTFQDDVAELARFLNRHRVTGLFANYPDVAVRARAD
ncbi:MAG: glycerophosphodiester phosphodiesterase family protein [Planctomycetota bacterium]